MFDRDPKIAQIEQQLVDTLGKMNRIRRSLENAGGSFEKLPDKVAQLKVAKELAALAKIIAETARLAAQTPNQEDDLEVVTAERSMLRKLDELVNSGKMIAPVRELFKSLTGFHRVTGDAAISINSEIRERVFDDNFSVLVGAITKLEQEYPGEFTDLARTVQAEGKKDTKGPYGGVPPNQLKNMYEGANRQLMDLHGDIKWNVVEALLVGKGLDSLRSDIEEAAGLIDSSDDNVKRFQGKLDDLIKKLKNGMETISFQKKLLERRNDPTAIANANELTHVQALIHRIVHEYYLATTGDRANPEVRKLFRPTTKNINENYYGEMMMFLGEVGSDIEEAEAMALQLTMVDEDKRKEQFKDAPEKIQKLEALLAKIRKIKNRYISLALSGDGGNLSNTTTAYLHGLIDEVEKYDGWLETLIAEARPVADGSGGLTRRESGGDHYLISDDPNAIPVAEKYREVVDKYSLLLALDRLVTCDFAANDDAKEVEDAYKELSRILEKMGNGYEKLGDVLSKVNLLYTYGWMHKGNTLHLDYLSIRWDSGKEKLKNANALGTYDQLCQTEVYKAAVKPLVNRAFEAMLNSGEVPVYNSEDPSQEPTTTEPNEWKASTGWQLVKGAKNLIHECHNNLYHGYWVARTEVGADGSPVTKMKKIPRDEGYVHFFDQFPADADRYNRNDVIDFIWNLAWYDTTLNDMRTKAAMVHLGILKSSFKHEGGQPIDATALLLNGGYQVKNGDLAQWATDFGGMFEPPEQILTGSFRLSQFCDWIEPGSDRDLECSVREEQGKGHKETMETYRAETLNYYSWLFGPGMERKIPRWKPASPERVFLLPTIDRVITGKLQQGQTAAIRHKENNTVNYMKALDAIAELNRMACSAAADPLTLPEDASDAKQQLHEMVKGFGSKLAEALSYAWEFEYSPTMVKDSKDEPDLATITPEEKRNAIARQRDQKRLLGTLTRFFLLNIMGKLPWNDLNLYLNPRGKEYLRYNELLEIFIEDVKKYAKDNSSFNIWSNYLTEVFVHTVEDHAFRRKKRLQRKLARRKYWNKWHALEGKSWKQIQMLPIEDVESLPTFPYKSPSKSKTDPKK